MRRLVIATLLVALARSAPAQEVLLPSSSWGFAPIVSAWHFAKSLSQSTGAVKDVAEVAVPFQFRVTPFGGSWTLDLTGAYAAGAIHVVSADSGNQSGGKSDDVFIVNGPTDLKVRLTGPLAEGLILSLGANVPIGLSRLDSKQTSVLQAVAAPALRMPVGAFGTGPGGTFGLVKAIEAGEWALALGGSVEKRTEYTPIALVLSTGRLDTKVTPGTAAHITLGADRVVGDNRLSLLVVGDGFTKDQVRVGADTSAGTSFDYQLGPQITGFTRLDMAGPTWRQAALNLAARYRSAFTDASGAKVAGSNGTYLEGSLDGVRGSADGVGLIIGIDGRWHSGLSFTDALVGAAATVGGATLGVEWPTDGAFFRLALHGQFGTFDTGVTKTTGYGGSLIFSFAGRRGGG